MEKIDFVRKFIDVCKKGYSLGWHERNAGNLSYRLTNEDINSVKSFLITNSNWIEIDYDISNLSNEMFLITGSGKYFGNIESNLENNIGIIEISESGNSYRVRFGFENDNGPTSELPTHLLNHSIKIKDNVEQRVIYHSHATNLIALTYILPLDDRVFTKALWQMATECALVFPEGVGVLPWMSPGSKEIGEATAKLMETYNSVIWAHHGIFCSGNSFEETLGLMHTIEKSAEILIKIFSTNKKVINTINDENLLLLEKENEIELNEIILRKEVKI